MIIATMVEFGTHAVIAFGEGKTENEAKANAICAVPANRDDLQWCDFYWEVTETND